MVDITGLTKRFETPRSTVEALSNISLTIERGSITGLLGANGAGKTTLIKAILGLVIPTQGAIHIDGGDVLCENAAVRSKVAAVLEGTRNIYWRLTPRENVAFFAQLHGVPTRASDHRVDRNVEAVGLTEKRDVLVRDLSRGMKQRCALACALVRGTPVLLLDEPTLGLDVGAKEELLTELLQLAEREGRTIVLSSHDMTVIERACDRVVVLDDGEIVADGSIAELKAAFDTQSWSVTFDGELSSVNAIEFQKTVDSSEVLIRNGQTRIDFVLSDPDSIFPVLAQLREAGLSLQSVERSKPNIGTIFSEGSATDATSYEGHK